MQNTNPEEALAKLEQLDKTRAEERMSLRHKNTGQWAKNQQIRAKYNKEVSIILTRGMLSYINNIYIINNTAIICSFFFLLDSTGTC